MTKEDQPEFVGFNFMGDIIEHCNTAKNAYRLAILNGFSEKQAQIICEEVEKKSNFTPKL